MPLLLLLTSLLVLSQSAIFIRFAEAPASVIGFWRLAIACAVLLGVVLWRKEKFRIERSLWVPVFVCAFLLFLHWYTWFLSVQNTSTANAIILFCSNPLYIAIGARIFFQEKMDWRHGASLTLCFAGIYLMVRESLSLNPEHLKGDLLGFVSSVLFAGYVLSSKGIRRRLDNIPFTFTIYTLAAFGFLLLALAEGAAFFGYGPRTWAAFSALAIGSTLLGHALFTHCLNYFNVNLMSVSTLSEPVFTALAAYWLFGEPVRSGTIYGFVFVTLGILVLYSPYLHSLLVARVKR